MLGNARGCARREGWWQRQGWIVCDPTIGIERRRAPPDRTKALMENQIAALRRLDIALREKTFWKTLMSPPPAPMRCST
ncbi:hypothetical protein ACFYY8_14450 [Streptosporangium sp. NPDC001559]|uniref:hypothetical protein n=1 Tax=Streptosporangium sp. NPDC001559 TaxID=3366187 RepID=UPI0036E11CEB